MRNRIGLVLAFGLMLSAALYVPCAAAQESDQKQSDAEAGLKPTGSFKVDFTVNELESGKKINSRSYSMRLNVNTRPTFTHWQEIRVGSRIPFTVEAGKFQYVDIGMNIDCRLMQLGRYAVVNAKWEYSTIGGERQLSNGTQNPVIRSVSAEAEAVVPLDQPTVISEVDDVASTHRYSFEVKVSKLND